LDPANSGSGSDTIQSPKFALAYKITNDTEIYANYGQGFHSNDVRGVEIIENPVEAFNKMDSIKKDSTTLVNLGLSYDFGPVEIGLDVLNVFDSSANDIEFLFESQLSGEIEPVEDIHFHPVEPFTLRTSVRYIF